MFVKQVCALLVATLVTSSAVAKDDTKQKDPHAGKVWVEMKVKTGYGHALVWTALPSAVVRKGAWNVLTGTTDFKAGWMTMLPKVFDFGTTRVDLVPFVPKQERHTDLYHPVVGFWLPPGTYTLKAFEVQDSDGETQYIPQVTFTVAKGARYTQFSLVPGDRPEATLIADERYCLSKSERDACDEFPFSLHGSRVRNLQLQPGTYVVALLPGQTKKRWCEYTYTLQCSADDRAAFDRQLDQLGESDTCSDKTVLMDCVRDGENVNFVVRQQTRLPAERIKICTDGAASSCRSYAIGNRFVVGSRGCYEFLDENTDRDSPPLTCKPSQRQSKSSYNDGASRAVINPVNDPDYRHMANPIGR